MPLSPWRRHDRSVGAIFFDLAADLQHRGIAGHEPLERGLVLPAQLHVVHFKFMHLERALDDQIDRGHVQRLLEVVVRAKADGTNRVFVAARFGRDDDFCVLVALEQILHQAHALIDVDRRILLVLVEGHQHNRGVVRLEGRNRGPRVFSNDDVVVVEMPSELRL